MVRGERLLSMVLVCSLVANSARAQQLRALAPNLALSRPISLDVAQDGSIAIADLDEPALHLIDSQGRLRWSQRKKGIGPGDVQRPYRVAFGENTVWLFDFAARDLSQFTRSGQFLRRVRPAVAISSVDGLVGIGDSLIALLGFTRQSGFDTRAIHIFRFDGQHVRSFGELPFARDRSSLTMSGTGTIERTTRGNILYTRKGPWDIVEYTPDGKLVRTIRAPLQVGNVADSMLLIETGKDGRERVSSRDRTIRFPLRTLEVANGRLLTGLSDRGRARWWISTNSEAWVEIRMPESTAMYSWRPGSCRLTAIKKSDDDEPALVEFPLPAVPGQSNRKGATCR